MNEKLHYDEFVKQISDESGYDDSTVRKYLDVMFETIVLESTKGNSVKIRNFGSFQPRWYKAKRGINPQTGQPLEILPHYHIHFASSKLLKNKINQQPSSVFSKLIFILLALLVIFGLYYLSADKDERSVKEKVSVAVEEAKKEEVKQEIQTDAVEIIEPVVEDVIAEVQEKEVIAEKTIETTQKPLKLYPGTYEVGADETLTEIGLRVYGTKEYWPLIYTNNSLKVSNPDIVLKGFILDIPDKTESQKLYSSYMDVHNAYMDADKMGKSFWILCEGVNSLDNSFNIYLEKKLLSYEYAIVKKCMKR